MSCSQRFLHLALILFLPVLISAGELASALVAACPTPEQFCNHALRYVGGVDLRTTDKSEYLTSSTTTYSYPSDTFTTTITSTGTTISKTSTLTKTVGSQTTTVHECLPTNTCGPVTVSGHQGVIRAACTSILRSISGKRTYTLTYGQPLTQVFGATTTSTVSIDATTTLFPVITRTVSTKTAYNCVTVPPPAASCKNDGVQFAEWDLSKKDQNSPPLQWDIEQYKTKRPRMKSSYDLIGGYHVDESSKKKKKRAILSTDSVSGCGIPLYDNARGYIYAPQTGTYHFYIPAYNQAGFIWVGEKAYSGYNISNALVKAVKPGHGTSGGPSANFHMEAGKYYAFRSAFRCISLYDYSYWFNIRRPDGFVMFGEYQNHGTFPSVLGSSSYSLYHTGVHYIESDYIMRFGCGADADEAPMFPAFGHET